MKNAKRLKSGLVSSSLCTLHFSPLTLHFLPSTFVCGLLLIVGGCAGYQLGNRSLYRADIRTVYVPMFESDSLRRYLGERLTEAVVKEIETKSPYKVLSDPNSADSVLTGRIVTEGKSVLAERTPTSHATSKPTLVVVVNWLDRQGFAMSQASTPSLSQQGFSVDSSREFRRGSGPNGLNGTTRVDPADCQTDRLANGKPLVGQVGVRSFCFGRGRYMFCAPWQSNGSFSDMSEPPCRRRWTGR